MASEEHRQRWKDLHNRIAKLGALMIGKQGDEFTLIAAEITKLQSEADALLREIVGEDAYQEYQRELASEIAKRKQAGNELLGLLATLI